MKQELLLKIVKYLIDENGYGVKIPSTYDDLKKLYKALVNIRMPKSIDEDILLLEDEYLKLELQDKKITDVKDLKEIEKHIILWKGDITTLMQEIMMDLGALIQTINVLITLFIQMQE